MHKNSANEPFRTDDSLSNDQREFSSGQRLVTSWLLLADLGKKGNVAYFRRRRNLAEVVRINYKKLAPAWAARFSWRTRGDPAAIMAPAA